MQLELGDVKKKGRKTVVTVSKCKYYSQSVVRGKLWSSAPHPFTISCTNCKVQNYPILTFRTTGCELAIL